MANDYFTASGWPSQASKAVSATGRSEIANLVLAFDKLPTLTAKANLPIAVNAAGNALESKTVSAFLTLLGINTAASIKTANFTAEAGGTYLVDVTASAVTVTLPASPVLGDARIKIIHYKGTITSNNITIGRNGKTLMGLAENMTVSTTNATVTLFYSDTAQGWRLDNI